MPLNLRRYMTMQKKEINEHKWYLSEKAGYDVGWDYTINDWIVSGHADKFQQNYLKHLNTIDQVCQDCSHDCDEGKDCILDMKKIHQLLENTQNG